MFDITSTTFTLVASTLIVWVLSLAAMLPF